jgi:hypothetical protein
MLSCMVPNGPDRQRTAQAALLAVAGSLSEAMASIEAGADLVELTWTAGRPAGADSGTADLGGADQADAERDDMERDAIGLLRARWPHIRVCGCGRAADLVRDPAVARATGALLICAGPDAARASGLAAGQVMVETAAPGGVQELSLAGWAVLLDADRAAQLARDAGRDDDAGWAGIAGTVPARDAGRDDDAAWAGIAATAALGCWLGAAVIRTRHPRPVSRALQMAACIQGTRPPARSVRGLA